MTGRFLINDPTEKMGVGTVTKQNVENQQKKNKQRNLQFYESSSCCQTLH